MLLIYCFINRSSFNIRTSFFLRYQTFLNFCSPIDDVITFKIYLSSFSCAMADRVKKRERGKYKNWNILKTKIAF